MTMLSNAAVISAGGYQIANSLRLLASASASLSRTPGSAGNRKTLARRFRIKRGAMGSLQVIASAGTASIDRFYFDSSDRLCLDVLGTARLVTTPFERDPTAWYVDVGFELDVGNGTAGSRAKILVDGVEVAAYSTDGRASITNTDTNWNNTVIHYIGRDNAGNYFDGYLSEPIGIDGSTTVASYSSTNSDGVRIPSAPSATWGTTGYSIPFNDGTSLTTLGYDRSGNGNNWTLNNVSLTAGPTYDWMVDTPTNNYCTLSPLDVTTNQNGTFGYANLRYTTPNSTLGTVRSTMPIPATGEWCWEVTATDLNGWLAIGVAAYSPTSDFINNANAVSYYSGDGAKYVDGVKTAYGSPYSTAAVIGVVANATAGTITFFEDGVSQGSISHAVAGLFPGCGDATTTNTSIADFNFGQRPMVHSYGSAKPLCTANRPTGSITTSGSFTGNANADGPVIWLNGNPETMTINGNAVTWGTHADKLAGGFKLRTSSASYNASGTNTYSVTVTGKLFGDIAHAPNTAKGNP